MKDRLTLAPRSGSHHALKTASHKVPQTHRLPDVQVSFHMGLFICIQIELDCPPFLNSCCSAFTVVYFCSKW